MYLNKSVRVLVMKNIQNIYYWFCFIWCAWLYQWSFSDFLQLPKYQIKYLFVLTIKSCFIALTPCATQREQNIGATLYISLKQRIISLKMASDPSRVRVESHKSAGGSHSLSTLGQLKWTGLYMHFHELHILKTSSKRTELFCFGIVSFCRN